MLAVLLVSTSSLCVQVRVSERVGERLRTCHFVSLHTSAERADLPDSVEVSSDLMPLDVSLSISADAV